jgi:hypothetical protein
MTDTSISPAEAMYPGGPISGGPNVDQRAQAMIEAGKAKPSLLGTGEAAPSAPPPPQEARRSAPTPESFNAETNAETVNLPEGVDRAALSGDAHFQEFATLAKAEGLNNAQSEKLVALHAKALKASYQQYYDAVAGWEKETKEALGDQVPEIAATIRSAIGNDSDSARFLQLMDHYGLGSNLSVIRVLHRLARGH